MSRHKRTLRAPGGVVRLALADFTIRVKTMAAWAMITAIANLGTAAPSWAQISVSARLAGMVRDGSGAALPRVSITATNVDTGLTRVTRSGDDGAYALAQLPPGRYRVTGALDGFTTAVVENVVLRVDDQVSLPLVLQVAPIEQTVTVEAPQALLQTQTAQVSAVVGPTQIRQLPLNGKDFADLIRLAPGVGGDAGGSTTNPSISGARLAGNSFSIDGVSANDERLSTAGLALGGGAANFDASAPNLVPSEAIAEFRVVTANADATYGRGSGGQVNVIVRSGSHQRQSSFYEYFRDESLDARNFFATEKLPFRQHLFGASHGGPLRHDRDFLFASYEGFRQDRQVPATLFVPNADLIRLVPGELGALSRVLSRSRRRAAERPRQRPILSVPQSGRGSVRRVSSRALRWQRSQRRGGIDRNPVVGHDERRSGQPGLAHGSPPCGRVTPQCSLRLRARPAAAVDERADRFHRDADAVALGGCPVAAGALQPAAPRGPRRLAVQLHQHPAGRRCALVADRSWRFS
jgi:hypothetical protein